MRVLIGLNGRKMAGKDTVYSFMRAWAAESGFIAVRRAFADKLKLSAYRNFKPDATLEEALEWANQIKRNFVIENVHVDDLRGYLNEEGATGEIKDSVTGRQFLQHYGTEAHREVFGQDFWVDALLPCPPVSTPEPEYELEWTKNFDEGSLRADLCIVTDVRFINEAQRIKDLGGFVWEVYRGAGSHDRHASESPLPPEIIDCTIDNEGTIDELRHNVRVALDNEILGYLHD